MERLQVSNGHLPPGEHTQTDKSGCGKDPMMELERAGAPAAEAE